MIQLNLLPDVKKEFLKAQQTKNAVISGAVLVSIVAAGVVALLATTVYGAQSLFIANLKKEIESNHQTVASKQEINKYLAIQSQLKAVDEASANRSVYARWFEYLPQLNPKQPFNITLYNAEIVKDGTTAKLIGSGANFEVVNNFKNTLDNAKLVYVGSDGQKIEKPLFVSVDSGSPSISNVNGQTLATFEFTLVFEPEAFSLSTLDPKIEVPKLTTSDGDQNAPKELFGASPAKTGESGQGDTNGN
ncbi:MAG: hypothetical protein ABIQ64_00400 [Candidatus Saccharimonadales bacterium]